MGLHASDRQRILALAMHPVDRPDLRRIAFWRPGSVRQQRVDLARRDARILQREFHRARLPLAAGLGRRRMVAV